MLHLTHLTPQVVDFSFIHDALVRLIDLGGSREVMCVCVALDVAGPSLDDENRVSLDLTTLHCKVSLSHLRLSYHSLKWTCS